MVEYLSRVNVQLAYSYPSSFCCEILQVPVSADGSATGDQGSVEKAGIWSQHELHSPYHQQALIYSVLPGLVGLALVDNDVICRVDRSRGGGWSQSRGAVSQSLCLGHSLGTLVVKLPEQG